MKVDSKNTYSYATDDGQVIVLAELSGGKLTSLSIKFAGSGQTPKAITPGNLAELADIATKATAQLTALNVTGLPTPTVAGQIG